MARQSRGRGGAVAFGVLLLLIGVVGGAVLYALSLQRPGQAIDGFGRAPIGCTTTLEFTETGTFYVFEERGRAVEVPGGGCQPLADPGRAFGFELRGPDGPVAAPTDTSLSYVTDDSTGTSLARVEIAAVGRYEIVAVGNDAQVVAAIGRDPDGGVAELRLLAIIVAAAGVLFGVLLLLLSGRRSKQAASAVAPQMSNWSSGAGDDGTTAVAHDDTRMASLPQPARPASEGLIDRRLRSGEASPWAPPTPDQAAIAHPEPPAAGAPVETD